MGSIQKPRDTATLSSFNKELLSRQLKALKFYLFVFKIKLEFQETVPREVFKMSKTHYEDYNSC